MLSPIWTRGRTYVVTAQPDFVHSLCNGDQKLDVKLLTGDVHVGSDFTTCNGSHCSEGRSNKEKTRNGQEKAKHSS